MEKEKKIYIISDIKDNDASSSDEAYKIADIRMCKGIGFQSKTSNRIVFIQELQSIICNGNKVSFPKPNNVSLCLSIAQKNALEAKRIYENFIRVKVDSSKSVEFSDNEIVKLYNYFEEVQNSLIFIYTAVEAFSNLSIPSDFKVERKNNKNITEIYDKKSIERWMTTSEKINEILPKIFHVQSPKTQCYWTDFKELESIRNDIIHQKTITDMNIFTKFLVESIFKIIGSGFDIIKYFCVNDVENPIFPYGFGEKGIAIFDKEFEDIFDIAE